MIQMHVKKRCAISLKNIDKAKKMCFIIPIYFYKGFYSFILFK